MSKKFGYVIAITGEIKARNRSQAYMLVQMGFALIGRLLEFPNNIAVRVEEIPEADQAEKADGG